MQGGLPIKPATGCFSNYFDATAIGIFKKAVYIICFWALPGGSGVFHSGLEIGPG